MSKHIIGWLKQTKKRLALANDDVNIELEILYIVSGNSKGYINWK